MTVRMNPMRLTYLPAALGDVRTYSKLSGNVDTSEGENLHADADLQALLMGRRACVAPNACGLASASLVADEPSFCSMAVLVLIQMPVLVRDAVCLRRLQAQRSRWIPR